MRSTMSDFPLTVGHIFEHGRATYADSVVVTAEAEGTRRISFAALAERAEQLAAGLRRLGVRHGDRVATFAWNTQEHQEAYFAVPCMGAVLHTVNIRLSPDQIRYIVGHAEDSVMLIDASLAPVLAPLIGELTTVRHLIVFGGGDRCGLPGAIDYEELLRSEPPGYRWPALEESAAAAMCYTSGTTDLPKGVVYSHRSTFLHSLGVCSGEALGLSQYDRILPVVPMFHGSAWGLPYAGWLVGADLVLPSRFIQAARLARLIAEERATFAAAVPTVWYDLLGLDPVTVDLSHVRRGRGPAQPDRGVRAAVRRPARPGLGPDRDKPGRVTGVPAQDRPRGARDRLSVHRGPRPWRRRDPRRGRRRRGAAARRAQRRRDRGTRALGDRRLLPRPGTVPIPRRLAPHRRRRPHRRRGLRHDQRPGQGRRQVGRRVDLLAGSGVCPRLSSGRPRGRG